MYRAGLESILGFQLRGDRLRIDPCVPRWWREFEITYRRKGATYRIKVENPLGVHRGVMTLQLDGAPQSGAEIVLADDGQTHNVRVVLGERPTAVAGGPEGVNEMKGHAGGGP
jgi:cyclic beta-1,2-glucan synthetase